MGLSDENQSSRRDDRFSQMMFGRRSAPPKSEPESLIEKYTANIDYNQFAESVQTLMEAYGELKPAISKISPFITKFINKDKT